MDDVKLDPEFGQNADVDLALWDELSREAPPILIGQTSSMSAYYQLEIQARRVGQLTVQIHTVPVLRWYQGLQLFFEPIPGVWPQAPEVEGNVQLAQARNTQMLIVGLELNVAKSALDLLIAANYSLAFASIRHLLDAYMQITYLTCFPERVGAWTDEGTRTPPMGQMKKDIVEFINTHVGKETNTTEFDRIYTSFDVMSKGTHPTGEGLMQVQAESDEDVHAVGADYREHLAYLGFEHGLFALRLMLKAILVVRDPGDEWTERFEKWKRQVNDWHYSLIDVDAVRSKMIPEKIQEIEEYIKVRAQGTQAG